MNFIKYHKLDVANEISSLVEHRAQDFRCHDETVAFWVDLHVTCEDADCGGIERCFEISEFLVGESFDR